MVGSKKGIEMRCGVVEGIRVLVFETVCSSLVHTDNISDVEY